MKSALLLLFFAISFLSQAQNWCPPGAVWTYYTGNVIDDGTTNFIYEKDTVIDGQACKKLKVTTDLPYYTTDPLFTYSQNDTVYFHYPDVGFWPTYFFNASVGDTIVHRNPYPEILCDATWKFIVDSVATVSINSEVLRYYRCIRLDTGLVHPQRLEVLEKLGMLNDYPMPVTTCRFNEEINLYGLNCYQDNGFPNHQRIPHIECKLVSAVAEVSLFNSLSLQPNPANTQISISTEGTAITQYQMLDYSGKLVGQGRTESSTLNIDVAQLAQGIYLLKLELANGQYAVKRFIKE